MLSITTPRQLAHSAERHALRMTELLGIAQQKIDALTKERDEAREQSADRLAILVQIGWTDQSKHFFALNFSEEQLAIFLEAASLAGETPEEFVVRGCRLLVEGAKA
jgi:hypothetical protein